MKKQEDDEGKDWLKLQVESQEIAKRMEDHKVVLKKIEDFERRDQARRTNKINMIAEERTTAMTKPDGPRGKKRQSGDDDLDNEDCNLIVDLPENVEETNEDSMDGYEQPEEVKPKIYYASRTHSQLNQFVNEVKKTQFANIDNGPVVKVVTLASRATLCINPKVIKLKDQNAINERCKELQKETKPINKCPFLQKGRIQRLHEDILGQVQDIEEIATRGRYHGACPYYASRSAYSEAELIVLPYNNLFHLQTRSALNLNLVDSVVIVDEAHNILETICSIHSSQLRGAQLIEAHSIISRYYARYHSRLNPVNSKNIKNIVHCLTVLIRYMRNSIKSSHIDTNTSMEGSNHAQVVPKASMVNVVEFIARAKLRDFNIFDMVAFFNNSQLARKLLGFTKINPNHDYTMDISKLDATKKEAKVTGTKAFLSKMLQTTKTNTSNKRQKKDVTKSSLEKPTVVKEEQAKSDSHSDMSLSFLQGALTDDSGFPVSYPIYSLIEFLRSLSFLAPQGRILEDLIPEDIKRSIIKFLLIEPSSQFKGIVEQARSIVLAGGTMQPFEEFVDLLFRPMNIKKERLVLFTCGHVIPGENLLVGTLARGPTAKIFDLSYRERSKVETLEELGRAIENISSIVPGGLICFFPSYDYEQLCFRRWLTCGIIKTIETKYKRVFREPKTSNQLKSVLDDYANCISKGRGGLLLSVVGGKMSEGINFNDDLGRCVIMIGMPYANLKSVELQEKMRFYDANSCIPKAGQMYYENLCLKGINQSIGRAIRHQNDYAAILLFDQRYQTKQVIRSNLPKWIGSSLKDYNKFDILFSNLEKFYKSKQT